MSNDIDMSEISCLIAAEFIVDDKDCGSDDRRYMKGVTDAMESAALAITLVVPEITIEQLREIILTVSDAVTNNI
jgi:hypothetical protein